MPLFLSKPISNISRFFSSSPKARVIHLLVLALLAFSFPGKAQFAIGVTGSPSLSKKITESKECFDAAFK